MTIFVALSLGFAAFVGSARAQDVFQEVSDEALAGMKPTELMRLFGHPSPVTRYQAARPLAAHGQSIVPAMVRALKHPHPWVRRAGCDVIITMCDPRHASKIRGKHPNEAGAEARREAAPTVGPLADLLTDADPWVRCGAAEALSHLGEEARSAAPKLLAAMEDPEGWVAHYAGPALAQVGIEGLERRKLYPALVRALKHPSAPLRKAAVQMLDQLGDDARPAAADLLTSVRERSPDSMFADGARVEAVRLLGKWKAPEAVPACLVLVEEQRWGGNYRAPKALEVLAKLGPAAKEAVPAIERLLASKQEGEIAKAATKALAAIQGGGK